MLFLARRRVVRTARDRSGSCISCMEHVKATWRNVFADDEQLVPMRVAPDGPPHPWDIADRPLRTLERVLFVPVFLCVCVPLFLLRLLLLGACALAALAVLPVAGRLREPRRLLLPCWR